MLLNAAVQNADRLSRHPPMRYSFAMADPTVTCPNCRREFELTEALAGPLLRAERSKIAAEESQKARESSAAELEKLRQERTRAEELIRQRDARLAEAQKNELELRRERAVLQQEKERFELDKQRAIDAARAGIREAAQKEVDDRYALKLSENQKTMAAMKKQIEDLQRKAEQGSQQLQGEIFELRLESILKTEFPMDKIEPVPKGDYGGDVLQHVIAPSGRPCGTILWESKRTKNWTDSWLAKLREDQRSAKADAAIIITQALPKGIDPFGHREGIWISDMRCVIPVAMAIRHALIEIAAARTAAEGQQTKMEMVYQYLTGPRFKHRVQAIVEKFTDMHDDLDKERKMMMRLWAKREEQIKGVLDATAGLYGDLQGIAGKSLEGIEGLSAPMLPEGAGE